MPAERQPQSKAFNLGILTGGMNTALPPNLIADTDAQYKALNTRREEWRAAIRTIEACTTVDAVNAVTYSTDIPAVD